ncbi:PadR family transcriptional regulator [Methanobacterium sp.]|uniref:PadR family transcriptional regulator n=1 Tax=Methanobacterium sp. TaxID=2164 RepID=UPI003C733AE5
MVRISNMDAAILGLLYEHHHYAYGLEEIIEKRAMRNWVDLESSVIDVLKKFEENDLVKSEIREVGDKRLEKVYSITDEGKVVFLKKIKGLLSEKSRVIYPFDLAIANMNFLSPKIQISSLESYLESLEERIEFIDDSIRIQKENNVPYNFIAILSRSSALLKAERDWVNEFIKELD